MRPVHLRMARAALNWTLREFEGKTGVNKNTVARYEAGGAILSDTLERLESALREEGIIFIEDDVEFGIGIRLRRGINWTGAGSQSSVSRETKPKRSRKSNK